MRDELTGAGAVRRRQQRFRAALDGHVRNLVDQRVGELLERLNPASQPDVNPLNVALWNRDLLTLNAKALGHQLARSPGAGPDVAGPAVPPPAMRGSKPCTQEDVESQWFAYWCRVLGTPPLYHRKL